MIDSEVTIELSTVARAEAIAAVLKEAFAAYEPLYTPAAFAATTPSAGELRVRWHEGPVWVATGGGHILGTVAAVPRKRLLYVRSMAVLPDARGHGIGRLLLEEVERHARSFGHEGLILSTTPFLHEAIRLYERFGFTRSDAGPRELHGTSLFTMEKSLDRPFE